ncbi:hypothetical protein DM02DRAFT_611420 [Periconia macrospinosa]|uniref:DUF829-domain-containing protein n=1 Tax=Periconia macrospinosa TaxID=97972 RepID=A0A2V1E1Z6_9PLEO|nr:hypothetical protein DM02DRAFT_611420 [Periconia macrospinosa]
MSASTPPTLPPLKPAIPPPKFTPLTPSTSLYTPTSIPPSNTPSPLILFFAWNAAPARPIQKYTSTYASLFPTSRILLLQTSTVDVAFRSSETLAKQLRPALDVVRGHTQEGGEVLLHLFSNGGGIKCVELVKAWHALYGGGIEGMRVRCMILDSSPGKGDWSRSHKAITASLPRSTIFHRVFFGILVHGLMFGMFLFSLVARKGHVMRKMCADLNDTMLFPPKRTTEGKTVPRLYLYSKNDDMVGWEEVEEHAEEARGAGWEVTTVRFEKSGHVAHVREDEARYWNEVLGAWERGS